MDRYCPWLRPIEVPSAELRRNASEIADGDVSGGVGRLLRWEMRLAGLITPPRGYPSSEGGCYACWRLP